MADITIEFLAEVNAELARAQQNIGMATASITFNKKANLTLRVWGSSESHILPEDLTAPQVVSIAGLIYAAWLSGHSRGRDDAMKSLRDLIGVDRRDAVSDD